MKLKNVIFGTAFIAAVLLIYVGCKKEKDNLLYGGDNTGRQSVVVPLADIIKDI